MIAKINTPEEGIFTFFDLRNDIDEMIQDRVDHYWTRSPIS